MTILAIITNELNPFYVDEIGINTGQVADIVFTSPSNILSTTTNLSIFNIGDKISIIGSTSNDGIYDVISSSSTAIIVKQITLTTESGDTLTISSTYIIETDIIEKLPKLKTNITNISGNIVNGTFSVDISSNFWNDAPSSYTIQTVPNWITINDKGLITITNPVIYSNSNVTITGINYFGTIISNIFTILLS